MELALTRDINEGLRICLTTPGALLIDVRDRDDYSDGHIPDSMNVPLAHIEEHIVPLVSDKDTPLFLYCSKGVKSMEAASILEGMGYLKATSIGGIVDYLGDLIVDEE